MNLPLSKAQVTKGAAWLLTSFGTQISSALEGKPYNSAIVCAIACKETGFIWIGRIGKFSAAQLLPLLVGDASGDVADAPRTAFPKNTAEFRAEYGSGFTNVLIDQANKARALRGLGPAKIVYKGYGIFQYDLQHVKKNRPFFEELRWHNIESCLAALTSELDRTFVAAKGDRWDAVRRYNGSGKRAEQYADHVTAFANWIEGGE